MSIEVSLITTEYEISAQVNPGTTIESLVDKFFIIGFSTSNGIVKANPETDFLTIKINNHGNQNPGDSY